MQACSAFRVKDVFSRFVRVPPKCIPRLLKLPPGLPTAFGPAHRSDLPFDLGKQLGQTMIFAPSQKRNQSGMLEDSSP